MVRAARLRLPCVTLLLLSTPPVRLMPALPCVCSPCPAGREIRYTSTVSPVVFPIRVSAWVWRSSAWRRDTAAGGAFPIPSLVHMERCALPRCLPAHAAVVKTPTAGVIGPPAAFRLLPFTPHLDLGGCHGFQRGRSWFCQPEWTAGRITALPSLLPATILMPRVIVSYAGCRRNVAVWRLPCRFRRGECDNVTTSVWRDSRARWTPCGSSSPPADRLAGRGLNGAGRRNKLRAERTTLVSRRCGTVPPVGARLRCCGYTPPVAAVLRLPLALPRLWTTTPRARVRTWAWRFGVDACRARSYPSPLTPAFRRCYGLSSSRPVLYWCQAAVCGPFYLYYTAALRHAFARHHTCYYGIACRGAPPTLRAWWRSR